MKELRCNSSPHTRRRGWGKLLPALVVAAVAAMLWMEHCRAATRQPSYVYSSLRRADEGASPSRRMKYFVLSPCGLTTSWEGHRTSVVIEGSKPEDSFRFMPCGMPCVKEEGPSEISKDCVDAANLAMRRRATTHKFLIQAPDHALSAVVKSINNGVFTVPVTEILVNCLALTDIDEEFKKCRGNQQVMFNPRAEDKYRRRKLLLLSGGKTSTPVLSPVRIPLQRGVQIQDRTDKRLRSREGLEYDLLFNGHSVSFFPKGGGEEVLAAGSDQRYSKTGNLVLPIKIESPSSRPLTLQLEKLNASSFSDYRATKNIVTLSALLVEVLLPFDDSAPIRKNTYSFFVGLYPLALGSLQQSTQDVTPLKLKQKGFLFFSCWAGADRPEIQLCARIFLGKGVEHESLPASFVGETAPQERDVYVSGGSVETIEMFVEELQKNKIGGNVILPQYYLLVKDEPDEDGTAFRSDHQRKQTANSSWAFYNDYKAIKGAGFFTVDGKTCYSGLVVRYNAKYSEFQYEKGGFRTLETWIEGQSGIVEVSFNLVGVSVLVGLRVPSRVVYEGARPERKKFVLAVKSRHFSFLTPSPPTVSCRYPQMAKSVESSRLEFIREEVTVKVNHTSLYGMASAETPIRLD